MAAHEGGQIQPQLDLEEHNHAATAKRVFPTYLMEDGSTYANEVYLPKSGTNTLWTAVTVTPASAAVLLNSNADRRAYLLCNHSSADDLYVGLDSSASATTGFILQPKEKMSDSVPGVLTGAFYGAATATLTVMVMEWER